MVPSYGIFGAAARLNTAAAECLQKRTKIKTKGLLPLNPPFQGFRLG
jgi:hypothetical protein